MTDDLERKIRALVIEIVETRPAPPLFDQLRIRTMVTAYPAARSGAILLRRQRRTRRALVAVVGLVAAVILAVVLVPTGAANRRVAVNPSNPIEAIATFPLPTPNRDLTHIVEGSDGNLWFTTTNGQLGRITPAGRITMFPLPNSADPFGVAAGPDGNIWFTATTPGAQPVGHIGRISPHAPNTITEYPLPSGVTALGITTGPDHNLWFSEAINTSPYNVTGRIARITPAGVITEFPIPSQFNSPDGITTGPDHALWFNGFGGQIGRISLTGHVTLFPVSAAAQSGGGGFAITLGPDHNLWFTEQRGVVGRITPTGHITEYPLPSNFGAYGITVGPDHNLWFGSPNIGRITTTGAITLYPSPDPLAVFPARGPGNTLWISGRDRVVRITLRR